MKRIILINLSLIILFIIFSELFIGFFKLSGIMGIDGNLLIEKENTYGFKKNSEGKVYGKLIYTDNNGFRIPNKEFNYQKNKPSIFFIGDSTTFGNGVKEERTFVGRLRIKKNNLNFYNSAVIGYQILHHSKNIDIINKFSNIIKIFYVFTLNDVFEIEQVENRVQNKIEISQNNFVNKLKSIKFFQSMNVYLRNKSYLYMFIKGIFSDPSSRYFEYVKNYYMEKKIYKDESDYFLKLKKLSEAKNIELKVLIIPYEYQTRKGQCSAKNLEPQLKITNMLKSLKINYIDYTSLFCNNKNPKKLFYKFDPMHLSEEGHNLIFSELQKKI